MSFPTATSRKSDPRLAASDGEGRGRRRRRHRSHGASNLLHPLPVACSSPSFQTFSLSTFPFTNTRDVPPTAQTYGEAACVEPCVLLDPLHPGERGPRQGRVPLERGNRDDLQRNQAAHDGVLLRHRPGSRHEGRRRRAATLARDNRARALLEQVYRYVLRTAPPNIDVQGIRTMLLEVAGPEGQRTS